jgi:hypothetical protein
MSFFFSILNEKMRALPSCDDKARHFYPRERRDLTKKKFAHFCLADLLAFVSISRREAVLRPF